MYNELSGKNNHKNHLQIIRLTALIKLRPNMRGFIVSIFLMTMLASCFMKNDDGNGKFWKVNLTWLITKSLNDILIFDIIHIYLEPSLNCRNSSDPFQPKPRWTTRRVIAYNEERSNAQRKRSNGKYQGKDADICR